VCGSSLTLHATDRLGSWDTRTPQEPTSKSQAHDEDILSVAFNPASEHILITGSADHVRFSHASTATLR
jgi:WD40 repeat protein